MRNLSLLVCVLCMTSASYPNEALLESIDKYFHEKGIDSSSDGLEDALKLGVSVVSGTATLPKYKKEFDKSFNNKVLVQLVYGAFNSESHSLVFQYNRTSNENMKSDLLATLSDRINRLANLYPLTSPSTKQERLLFSYFIAQNNKYAEKIFLSVLKKRSLELEGDALIPIHAYLNTTVQQSVLTDSEARIHASEIGLLESLYKEMQER